MSFVVYKSSAGSGKTFTLVFEYLKLVIESPSRFSSILAITFTNKAANEMKERLITYLKHLNKPGENRDSPAVQFILPELTGKTGQDQHEISKRAGQVLSMILHQYSDFSIGTIDGFIYRIIRTFAHDLNLPVNFEVELDNDSLISEAVDLLINDVGRDEALTDLMLRFVMSKIGDEKGWNIDRDLKKFAKSLLSESGQIFLDKLKELTKKDFSAISSEIRKFRKEFESEMQAMGQEAMRTIGSTSLTQKDFYQGSRGVYAYFKALATGNFNKLQPNNYALTSIEEDKWLSGSADEAAASEMDRIKPALYDVWEKINLHLEDYYQRYILLGLIYKNLYPVAVLNEINKQMEAIKALRNQVHISEFNRRIAEIVLSEPIPFIYERLGERYKYFLIDEFQDTSVLQWQNLLPLVENALSESNFSLIVGDGKQAIYRWRNGEVEQFARLPKIYPPSENPVVKLREESLRRNYSEKVLRKNFRSDNVIVEFNNALFSSLEELLHEEYRVIYGELKQQAVKNESLGYVSLQFHSRKQEENFQEYNLNCILSHIRNLTSQNFNYRDIAVICRSNDEASRTAIHLIGQEIPVVSSQSLLLGNSEKLNFIVSFIRWLMNPSDVIARLGVLAYLYRADGLRLDENLRELLIPYRTGDLFDQDVDGSKNLLEILRQAGYRINPDFLKGLSIYDLSEALIRIFQLNQPSDPFVQFFLDFVYDYTSDTNSSMNDFLEHWDEKKGSQSIVMPENLDAVRILTIHKAKGLEFPVVIFPFANQLLKPANTNIWVESEQELAGPMKATFLPANQQMSETIFAALYEEESEKSMLDLINLLYVTMTRPTHRLYVISSGPPKVLKDYKSVPKMLKYFLQNNNLWEEDKDLYEFGKQLPFTTKEKKETSDIYKMKEMISADWRDRMILSLTAPDFWEVEDPTHSTEWGKLLHRIMAEIEYREDAAQVLENFRLQGFVDTGQLTWLHESIDKLMKDPEIGKLFTRQYSIRREGEIMDQNGRSYRPDRMASTDGKLYILDYKTGSPNEKHREQIQHYARLMQEIGYKNLESYLVYLNEDPEVLKI